MKRTDWLKYIIFPGAIPFLLHSILLLFFNKAETNYCLLIPDILLLGLIICITTLNELVRGRIFSLIRYGVLIYRFTLFLTFAICVFLTFAYFFVDTRFLYEKLHEGLFFMTSLLLTLSALIAGFAAIYYISNTEKQK